MFPFQWWSLCRAHWTRPHLVGSVEGGGQASYWEFRAVTRELAATCEGYWSILRNVAIFLKWLLDVTVIRQQEHSALNFLLSVCLNDTPTFPWERTFSTVQHTSKKELSQNRLVCANLLTFSLSLLLKLLNIRAVKIYDATAATTSQILHIVWRKAKALHAPRVLFFFLFLQISFSFLTNMWRKMTIISQVLQGTWTQPRTWSCFSSFDTAPLHSFPGLFR